MPKVRGEGLREMGRALLAADGVPEPEAATVAWPCVSANLAGHDSHGAIQLPGHVERAKAGHNVPGAPVHRRAGKPGHGRGRRHPEGSDTW